MSVLVLLQPKNPHNLFLHELRKHTYCAYPHILMQMEREVSLQV